MVDTVAVSCMYVGDEGDGRSDHVWGNWKMEQMEQMEQMLKMRSLRFLQAQKRESLVKRARESRYNSRQDPERVKMRFWGCFLVATVGDGGYLNSLSP